MIRREFIKSGAIAALFLQSKMYALGYGQNRKPLNPTWAFFPEKC
jgi:hypothetical protein